MCGAQIAQPGDPDGPRSANATQLGRPMVLPEGMSPPGSESTDASEGLQSASSSVQATRPAQVANAGAPSGQDVWAMHTAGEDSGRSGQSWSGASMGGSIQHRPAMSSSSMSGVTLSGLGIQSAARTWGVLIGGALLLFSVGALSMWLLMGRSDTSDATETADGEATSADDVPEDLREDFEVGTPLPEGVEPPEVDFVSGDVRPTRRSEPPPRTTVVRGNRRSKRPAAAGSVQSSERRAPDGSRESQTERTASAEVEGRGAAAATSAGESSTADGPSAGGSGAANAVPTEVPEDRDMAMELYTGRVRFVIRRYYASRAQSCFDRATRNEQELRGTVVVSFTIGADGQVGNTSVARNSTGNDTLGTCLAGQMRSWRLPPPPNGEIELEMPFSR